MAGIPGHAAAVAKAEQRDRELAGAASAPLPGPLRDAFAGEPNKLHGYTLLPVTAGLIAILTRIESPLLDIIRVLRQHAFKIAEATTDEEKIGAQKEIAAIIEREVKPDPEQNVETVYCFIHTPPELRKLLDRGRAVFREQVMTELGDKVHPGALFDLEKACGEHFTKSFSTIVNYEAPPSGDGSVFTPPPAAPETASAGGSTSSVK